MVGGGWWLAVGGWRRLAVVGSWRLVAAGGWRRLAVDGSWRLAVGGPLGRFLRAVLSKKKKKSGPLRTPLSSTMLVADDTVQCQRSHKSLLGGAPGCAHQFEFWGGDRLHCLFPDNVVAGERATVVPLLTGAASAPWPFASLPCRPRRVSPSVIPTLAKFGGCSPPHLTWGL